MRIMANGLKKVFNRRTVFKDISFEVRSGQILSITGPNGSGKSTASKILCGVLTPTSGTVTLENSNGVIDRDNIHKHIGFVAPYLELYGEFTALENLKIESKARRLSRSQEENALEILNQVGLFNRRNDEVKGFSSGMKQRLKYAAAIVHDPDVLVLDEPTANLDVAGSEMVFKLIEVFRRDKVVVLATNDKDEAALGDVKVELTKSLGSSNGRQ